MSAVGYTVEQYNALVEAIALGATKVKYQDKEVEYGSYKRMMAIKAQMENELGIIPNQSPNRGRRNITVGVSSSGL